ncbi:MAG TPA: serine hydrolase domain-containing protein [Cyclobacteriaceae bacterium]|nr:serine hydrolase domain-containing protein [Cyclobacteriaceae bacterium]HRJ81114.1 serine hydrolase domain-containing protein [Cyclobacteriaceae bacterium]
MKRILTPIFSFILVVVQAQVLLPAKPENAGLSPERLKRIDQMVNELVESKAIPGAVVLIARNGKIVYHQAYGYSDVDSKKTMQKDNIFRIASQSKAIASLAAMILWEEGKFQLDDPVSRYIPEFKNPTVLKSFNAADSSYTTEPAGREITIRHLLTHTSGIDYAAIGSNEFKAIYAKAGVPSGIGNDGDVIGDKIKILAKLPLKHKPGERWTYGLNIDVIGYLVELWSGMPFDQFLKKRVFDPLGMKDTWFYLPKDKHDRLVTLYSDQGGKLARQVAPVYDNVNPDYPKTNGKYFSGGAGLSSTVEDYAKFLHLFLNKGQYNGVRILSRKTVELILTNQLHVPDANPFGLAFGLETDSNDYQSIVSIGSFSWGGAFNTHYWADPKEQLIGIIYTNMYNSSQWSLGSKFKVLVYQAIND